MPNDRGAVIRTKLSAPSLPAGLVGRPRLLQLLDSDQARLILVTAPAGFGKTALILEWLSGRRGSKAWLSVDRPDNDPTRFFNHLAAAIETLPAAEAGRAATLVRTLGQRSGEAPDVQDAFAALGCEPVLVLDDVHELEEPVVFRGLEQLLAAGGPRLVFLTRVDPPLALGRMRVSGELLELRERDLRFTSAECATLFEQLLPGELDRGLVEQLEQRTEGWVAGLRLAAIALRHSTDPAAAVASFAGTHRMVVDYLVEEALEKQDQRVQQFLMDTSVLERFTPEAAAAVTGDAAAGTTLAEVEAASLFLVPLGSDRHWFRYHHLFRELLEFRLRRLQPGRAEVLHARASAWFEQAGDSHAAIEHACRLADRTRLLELLDVHGMAVLARSELATIARWLGHLPDPLAEPFPMVIVTVGWLRVLTERAPNLQVVFDAAEAALARIGPGYDERRQHHARLRLDVLRAFAARFLGRLDEALLITRAVLQDLPDDDPFTRGLVLYNLARLEMVMGDMARARELLERSFDDNLRAGTTYVVLTGLGQAATVAAQLEGVERARAELNTAIAFAEQRHLTGLPAFSAVLYHLGNIEYLADRLDEAAAAAQRAVALGRPGNFPEGYANGLMVLARVAVARGEFGEAEALLTETAALERNSNVVLLDTTIAVEQARLGLAREQYLAGPPAAPIEVPVEGSWTTAGEAAALLALRQALRSEDYPRAAALATRLRAEAETRGRGVALVVALLAQALLPDRPDRWELLDRALRLAATRGYIRPLIDGGDVVRALLQAGLTHVRSPEARAHARLLLQRLDAGAAKAPAPLPVRAALLEPLTSREEDVLGYLFQGHSNKAIARAMFVSVETVKTHLKHLYWKLGASDRDGAVTRARELGIAPRNLA